MKILHTGDWHIGSFPGPEKDGVNLRGQDTLRCIDSVIETARAERPDAAVIAGDVFHQARVWAERGLIETRVAIRKIEELAEICPVVVLRGTPNHDGPEQFAMLREHFKDHGGVYIITDPQVVWIVCGDTTMQIACLPGFDAGEFRTKFPGLSREEENRRFTEELGKIVLGLKARCDPAQPSMLIAHYTVPGCNMESGQTQFFIGAEPMLLPETLDAAGFDLVALGHIHRPQQLDSCRHAFYCGAVNAMNFNDEGQGRGFWIHELEGGLPYDRLLGSSFYPTPYRKFETMRWADCEITAILNGDIDDVARNWWIDPIREVSTISGEIIRVLYSCSEEKNKAFSKAMLEKRLYDDGAFWVAEILLDQTVEAVNREALSERTDPEQNLARYLDEKGFMPGESAKVIEAARPIIAQAAARGGDARITGLFEPLEIEVHNYRKYADEHFDFRDISLCTVNGKNGAGKSSLFMDAIVDCLYEEPREGELTGWISKDESKRSGSISFTFRIGFRTFRVVRTRAKSGKATLNLSELVDDEWVNRSAEKLRDTQERVTATVGMDSLTLESCALIMQDKYGLFLQADKENRMAILGNILGLGVYGDMERLTRDKLSDVNRQIMQGKAAIAALSEQVKPEETLRFELLDTQDGLRSSGEHLSKITHMRTEAGLALASREQAAEHAASLEAQLRALQGRAQTAENDNRAQEDVIAASDAFLTQEVQIMAGVAGYNDLLTREKELISGHALYETKRDELGRMVADIADKASRLGRLRGEADALNQKITRLRTRLLRRDALREEADRYEREKDELAALQERGSLYITMTGEITTLQQKFAQDNAAFREEAARRKTEVQTLQAKKALLEGSGCVDPGNAQCRFLSDAQEARQRLDPYLASCTEWRKGEEEKLSEIMNQIQALERQRDELNYDAQILREKKQLVASLEPLAAEYRELEAVEDQIALLSEQAAANAATMQTDKANLSHLEERASELSREVDQCRDAADQYAAVRSRIQAEKGWLEKEKLIPVIREKKEAAQKRHEELKSEIADLTLQSIPLQQQLDKTRRRMDGADDLREQCAALDTAIEQKRREIGELQEKAGSLRQRLEDIARTRESIDVKRKELNGISETAAAYEVLKTAFSQDGIPHSIVRSILPQLTDTANAILGQMTGGKMGMEFITEKQLKSNKDKEVAVLDIRITDGRESSPYDSNSGGEKVKAALSAILALSELQSTTTGIQLGMLFIDEPPFLDDEGTQAYCDALEAIKRRFPTLKILTITHDPSMKARFPQSLTVEKTDEGSKVIAA